MTETISFIGGALVGASAMWLYVSPKLTKLSQLTDRDERGRFVRRDP